MNKNKSLIKSFTMIELIFVILIIATLVAVAIPKLFSRKKDVQAIAQAVAIAQEVQTAIEEIISDATTKGGDLNATALVKRSQILKRIVERKKGYEWHSSSNNKNINNGVEIYGDIYGDCKGSKCRCVSFLEDNETTLIVHSNPHSNGPICSEVKHILKTGEWGRTNGIRYNITGTKVKF